MAALPQVNQRPSAGVAWAARRRASKWLVITSTPAPTASRPTASQSAQPGRPQRCTRPYTAPSVTTALSPNSPHTLAGDGPGETAAVAPLRIASMAPVSASSRSPALA